MRLSFVIVILVGVLGVGCGAPDAEPQVVSLTTAADWAEHTAQQSEVQVRASGTVGGRIDVTGDGALLLQRPDTTEPFVRSDTFVSRGHWTSDWLRVPANDPLGVLTADIRVYGQPQDVTTGWTKFSGNPLVSGTGFAHATDQTLQLPDTLQPNDQSLVRGTGPYEGQWLLLFNVGPWAIGGWAAAVADSLAPLKRGKNPFRLVDPFPLFVGNSARDTLGYHAPNDWISVDGTWYSPDESRDLVSRLWTSGSSSLTKWTNEGPIQNMQGHDPGLAYDGERFYLFAEDSPRILALSSADPLGPWTQHGVALQVGGHTGDPDPTFFNNAWHVFYDDAPHQEYTIGYARTAPSAFPKGWHLTHDIYGPRTPDEGQAWDEPTRDGNDFGTGDPDVAIEGTTLYMTHERPTGVAYKELALTDDTDQTVRLRLDVDTDGDGTADESREQTLSAGNARLDLGGLQAEQIRLRLDLETRAPAESPMIRSLQVRGPGPQAAAE